MAKEFLDVPFEIKNVNDDGTFSGYGSTFGNIDSYNDIVEKGAFTDTLSKGGHNGYGVAMLWQHDPSMPIGSWIDIREDDSGLRVEGKLAMGTQKGKEAHALMTMNPPAIKGMSIGFDTKGIKDAVEWDKDNNIRHIKKTELWEISLVTFPANTAAQIITVKSLEEATTKRELEGILRESGLSKSVSQYIVKHFNLDLRESDQEEAIVRELQWNEYLKLKESTLNGGK